MATAPSTPRSAPASVPGQLSFGLRSFACEVEELTTVGARLRCADAVRPWSVVTLRIEPFGKFHGRVVWQRAGSMGLQFLDSARAVLERYGSA